MAGPFFMATPGSVGNRLSRVILTKSPAFNWAAMMPFFSFD